MKKFPFYRQLDKMDCGPSCLRMICKYYGKSFSLERLRENTHLTRRGVSFAGLCDAAENIGFRTLSAKISFEKLKTEAPLPLIAHWKEEHFVVIHKIHKEKVYVADPSYGLITYNKTEFLDGWIKNRNPSEDSGLVLLLETTPEFYNTEDDELLEKGSFKFLLSYLYPYKRFLIQLLIGLLAGSLLQLLFPFLTQAIVDVGINNREINFIHLILIAQLMLFFSRTAVDFIQSWLLLYIGSRINIYIISDFLIKLMKLPVSFFDSKMMGDLLQRIGDHRKIELFLSTGTLNMLFSFFNLIIFAAVLAYYNATIFGIFFLGSLLYAGWILIFLKKRKELNHKSFNETAKDRSNLIQLISAMQEIRLHNAERQKRWEWERIQAKVFRIQVKALRINQYQQAGSVFINEFKNIIITFFAAKSVIDGEITLGMMLAIQYIIGQLNAPISQLISFIHITQDARISMERLAEIHNKENEEENENNKVVIFPERKSLLIQNLSFSYEGPKSTPVLRNLTLEIPEGKITAIVGASGSGKTTLIKLLLKIYNPTSGEIRIGDIRLENFSNKLWRDKCGAVLQDGFIFSDTVAKNIVINDEHIDRQKLLYAVKVANIQEFIESLPLGYDTKIGRDGHGLSQGQKQRILIARAVYKDPEYIYFDEATNALDANNERVIMENLNRFFKGRTVIVVAHRLSTVKNADQIIVLDKGMIIEQGTHKELTHKRESYYRLVKNQLELGN